MKLIRPEYFREFHCLADRCTDTCCAGWEICIDPESHEYYQNLPGPTGEKLRKNIISTQDGYEFSLMPGKRCPFLNAQNLCELILELGENSLCEICREHPRFYDWFGDYTLSGLGLCCEEAARLILTRDTGIEICHVPGAPMEPDEEQLHLVDWMKPAWTEAMRFMGRSDLPLNLRLIGLLTWGETLQEALETGEPAPRLQPPGPLPDLKKRSFHALEPVFRRLEALEADWPEFLAQALRAARWEAPLPRDFEPCIRRLTCYFLYRYFMQALYDGDVVSKVKFSVLSAAVIGAMALHTFESQNRLDLCDWIMLAKRYSKEIEYSDQNVETLFSACWREEALQTESLIGLFVS